MQQIEIPPGCPERRDFVFVLVANPAGIRYPALLTAWIRLPDGRLGCRLLTPGARVGGDREPRMVTALYDERITEMTKFSIVQPE